MLDAGPQTRLRAQAAPPLPIDRMVLGKPVAEVEALLPRLFSLCRAAQGAGVQAALGKPVTTDGIAAEVLRDHVMKLFVSWPGHFGMAPLPLPPGWADGGADLAQAVFGPTGHAPQTGEALHGFVASDLGVAPVLRRIAGCFDPGEAAAQAPRVTADTIWDIHAGENSVAARHADHPALRALGDRAGQGPLWRAVARVYDVQAAMDGCLPAPTTGPGWAVVPATRGLYGIALTVEDGCVTAFARVTPTDHLLAQEGILDRALSSLPAEKAGLAPLLLDILDPCSPVRLREGTHA
ncbi:HupK protein [Jannaschia pagri]|uniref:HupK protein n=1 Tax=Jannaschia pagri TaxID=2829797 RepID=A0ABQ4NR20_9RHOB|nr:MULTISPECIES: hydrogenase expression/formation protein HupK [unclassified Jannaschia]GIT93027.1 HupK protein [Jannaschia sp. AI_61]GIT96862.1 HupK protein [Jannaschia sp. AI_62]